jgi:hypothetical protein
MNKGLRVYTPTREEKANPTKVGDAKPRVYFPFGVMAAGPLRQVGFFVCMRFRKELLVGRTNIF